MGFALTSKIALGCAQVGQPYGINNTRPPIGLDELVTLITHCFDHGIDEFDTAPKYGDSEQLLGLALKKLGLSQRVKITSKILGLADISSYADCERKICVSLDRLGASCLENVLVHAPADFTYMTAKIDFFVKAQEKGLIKQFGLSIYDKEDLEYYRQNSAMQVVQCPGNLIDHRLVDTVSSAPYASLTKYFRSVFLQGLIFKKNSYLADYFPELSQLLVKTDAYCDRYDMSRYELFLSYMLSRCEAGGKLVIGVDGLDQLAQLTNVLHNPRVIDFSFMNDYTVDYEVLDPRHWKVPISS